MSSILWRYPILDFTDVFVGVSQFLTANSNLLCCVATCFILFPNVYQIFNATVGKLPLKSFKNTAHTFFPQSRLDSRGSFLKFVPVAIVCDYKFSTKDDDFQRVYVNSKLLLLSLNHRIHNLLVTRSILFSSWSFVHSIKSVAPP